jgi:hypothetical protein
MRLTYLVLILLCIATLAHAQTPPIIIDGNDSGPTFDGVGALSAGASSRLLIDYPPKQRDEILDYLFKPNFGAALQINKVEIGGDMNSTDGAEPSHMRTPSEENYHRGYEWWLMAESKKRNAAIKLYGLEWGAPGWINPKGKDVWTPENILYITKWLQHAASDYQCPIDYVGGWNERGFDKPWYEQLRAGLAAAGLSRVKIVADDSFSWKVGAAASADPAFAASFDFVGMHYPKMPPIDDPKNPVKTNWQKTLTLGKPLWASEIGSANYNGGARGLAVMYNNGFVDLHMTSFTNWSTIWSVLPGMPYNGAGLMLADEPWSGHYEVGLSIWATAHTTQFTQPGWHYLEHACRHFDGMPGSFVVLRSPTGSNFSLIAQTAHNPKATELSFSLAGGLASGPLHVWKTNLRSSNSSDWFIQQPDLPPRNNLYTLSFDPDCIYTLTTTTGQSKGQTQPPASAPFPLPYKEDFQSYEVGRTPRYFSDQHGAFEIAPAGGGRGGKCLRQVVTTKPVCWNGDADPGTIIGGSSWTDYTITCDALLEQPGWVDVTARIGPTKRQNRTDGYHLRLTDTGHFTLLVRLADKTGTEKTLAQGDLPKTHSMLNEWHTLALTCKGPTLSAAIDGQSVVSGVTDTTYPMGLAALQSSRWINAQFMNFSAK